MRFFCCFPCGKNSLDTTPLSPKNPGHATVEQARKYLEDMKKTDTSKYNGVAIGSRFFDGMSISDFLDSLQSLPSHTDANITEFAQRVLNNNPNSKTLYDSCVQSAPLLKRQNSTK